MKKGLAVLALILIVGLAYYVSDILIFKHHLSTEELKAKAVELIQRKATEANIENIRNPVLVHSAGNLYEGYVDVSLIDPVWGTEKPAQLDFELIYDKESVMLKTKAVTEKQVASDGNISNIFGAAYKSISDLPSVGAFFDNIPTGVMDARTGAFYPLENLRKIITEIGKVQPSAKVRITGTEVFIGMPFLTSSGYLIFKFDCAGTQACLLSEGVTLSKDGTQSLDAITLATTLTSVLASASQVTDPNVLNEVGMKSDMRTFSSAAESFRAAQEPPRYPSSITELTRSDPPYLIAAWESGINGYSVTFQGTENTYSLLATPKTAGVAVANVYCVDQTGMVVGSVNGQGAPTSNPVRCNGGTQVGG